MNEEQELRIASLTEEEYKADYGLPTKAEIMEAAAGEGSAVDFAQGAIWMRRVAVALMDQEREEAIRLMGKMLGSSKEEAKR